MTITMHTLRPVLRRKRKKILGRGNASGQGTYSGRGIKGQHARAGRSRPPGFEGGRSSIIVQTPKLRGRGFKPRHAPAEAVAVEKLNAFTDGDTVTLAALRDRGFVQTSRVKILAGGELKRRLTLTVPASAGAREKVEKAGGKVLVAANNRRSSHG